MVTQPVKDVIAAQALQRIFKGYNFITLVPEKKQADVKGKVKGKYQTLTGEPPINYFLQHIQGKLSLGVVPVDSSGLAFWGVIDIDVYDDKGFLLAALKSLSHFNLGTAFYSKSKGVHVYFFWQEKVLAKDIVAYLKKIVTLLNFNMNAKSIEIFPKQTVATNKGSGINIPFFGTTRKMIEIVNGQIVERDLTHFLEVYPSRVLHNDVFNNPITLRILEDGPPCLERLYFKRDLTNLRTLYLFNFCILLKSLEQDLNLIHKMNGLLDTQLPEIEVSNIIQSNVKNTYFYQCSLLKDYCDRAVCQKKTHGVGSKSLCDVTIENIIRYDTLPPKWSLTIEGVEIKVYDADDLITFSRFQKLILKSKINKIPSDLKRATWLKIINPLLAECEWVTVVEDEFDDGSIFQSSFVDFLTSTTYRAESRLQLKLDRVYIDKIEKKFYFTRNGLINFLHTKAITGLTKPEISDLLRSYGVENVNLYLGCVEGKGVKASCWAISFDKIAKYPNVRQDIFEDKDSVDEKHKVKAGELF